MDPRARLQNETCGDHRRQNDGRPVWGGDHDPAGEVGAGDAASCDHAPRLEPDRHLVRVSAVQRSAPRGSRGAGPSRRGRGVAGDEGGGSDRGGDVPEAGDPFGSDGERAGELEDDPLGLHGEPRLNRAERRGRAPGWSRDGHSRGGVFEAAPVGRRDFEDRDVPVGGLRVGARLEERHQEHKATEEGGAAVAVHGQFST